MPQYIAFIRRVLVFLTVSGMMPQSMVHSSPLLGDFGRSENEIAVLSICKGVKVSACSAILIELRMRLLSLGFFFFFLVFVTIKFPLLGDFDRTEDETSVLREFFFVTIRFPPA